MSADLRNQQPSVVAIASVHRPWQRRHDVRPQHHQRRFRSPRRQRRHQHVAQNARFKRRDALTSAGGNVERDVKATGLEIRVALADVNYEMIKKDTKESYTLSVSTNVVTIDADNFFGARHAVETLFQVAEKPGTLTEREGSVQLTSLY